MQLQGFWILNYKYGKEGLYRMFTDWRHQESISLTGKIPGHHQDAGARGSSSFATPRIAAQTRVSPFPV
jgi:hypothetical protein